MVHSTSAYIFVILANSIAGLDVSKYIVSLRDDEDPAFTFRSFVLGSAFTALSSVITMLYVFKPYQAQVSFTFLQRESISVSFVYKR